MVELRHSAFVDDAIEDMVVVTGIPRSGTSIFGQLIGSFSTVEYAYEPPMVNFFDATLRHGEIDPETVEDIFLPYLYFEHFAEYLHGRRYSFREGDFSYILGMKTVPELLEQWRTVNGLGDAIERAPDHTFSFKYPGFYDLLSVLYEATPSIKVIDLGRNLERIVASMYDKEWFFDHTLRPNSPGRWPYHSTDSVQVPYLVDEDDADWWQEMSPSTRTVYVCNRFAEDRLTFLERYGDRETYEEVRYERFVECPNDVAEEVAEFLDLAPGQRTPDVIDSVKSTPSPANLDQILSSCDRDVQERYAELSPRFEL